MTSDNPEALGYQGQKTTKGSRDCLLGSALFAGPGPRDWLCEQPIRATRIARKSLSMDIHSPTLSQPAVTGTRQTLNGLLEEKVILEGTLAELNSMLEKHGVGCVSYEVNR